MHTLRAFFGHGFLNLVLTSSIGIVIIVCAAMLTSTYRQWLARMKSDVTWRGPACGLGCGVFKFLFIFLLLRLFITGLGFQATIFERQHGRLTEKNRSAVLMKWGYPHEQKELSVSHTRKRTWVTRQLYIKGQADFADSLWKDETAPPRMIKGKRPKIVATKEEIKSVSVPQKSIHSADIQVTVNDSPRKLGNANYAGYEDIWRFEYVIENKSKFPTTAHMSFQLPAKTGLFDEMALTAGNTDVLPSARVSSSSLSWDVEMPAESTIPVTIGYHSRGLEYLRYIPKRMTQTGHYRLSMTMNGIPADKLDYPIGSMPPKEDIADLKSSPYTLTWKLDNALTSYDIGVRLPDAEQPEYYFARLLRQSPMGLIFLVALLTVTRIMLRQPVRLELMAIMAVAYSLHYTFMGRLADFLPGFIWPFAISTAIMFLVIAWFRSRDNDRPIVRFFDIAIFTVVIILYPLAMADSETTSFWMQLLYLASLVHVCSLLVAGRLARPSS
jgi:hypothetical protein